MKWFEKYDFDETYNKNNYSMYKSYMYTKNIFTIEYSFGI